MVNDWLSIWGIVGYGERTLVQSQEDNQSIHTDLSLILRALGVRGELIRAPEEGGLSLAFKSDAMKVHTKAKRTNEVRETNTEVMRLRLAMEASYPMVYQSGMSLTPSIEIGARLDGGDADTGMGSDVSAGVVWAHPEIGLLADARMRTLLAHETDNFKERSLSGSLAWKPSELGHGPSASISHTLKSLPYQTSNGSIMPSNSRFQTKFGYGFPFGSRFVATPHIGFGLTDSSHEYFVEGSLVSSDRMVPVQVSLRITRHEKAYEVTDHEFMMRGSVKW